MGEEGQKVERGVWIRLATEVAVLCEGDMRTDGNIQGMAGKSNS